MKKLFLLILMTSLLLAACAAPSKTVTPLPAPKATASQPQATLAQPQATQVPAAEAATLPSAPSLSADDVYLAVKAAWAKVDKAGPRHISQTTSEGLSTEADFVPPDFHQVVSVGGNVVAEQYVVGGTIYANVQGAWTQMPGGNSALGILGNFTSGISDSLVYSVGMVNGIETINGSPATVYSYSTTLKGLDGSSQYKLWVDQVSGLPVKSVNVGPDGMTITQIITYSNNLAISLPVEAQNAPTPAQ